MSKKRKEAEDAKAQLEKGRQQQRQRTKQQRRQDGEEKRNKNYVFQYGIYHRYYEDRIGRTVDEDPRLKFFEKVWFEGKDCFDIGCNEGSIITSTAQKDKCRSILGVDIDHFLIEKATRNIREADKASDY